jgi:hypothetical protein
MTMCVYIVLQPSEIISCPHILGFKTLITNLTNKMWVIWHKSYYRRIHICSLRRLNYPVFLKQVLEYLEQID